MTIPELDLPGPTPMDPATPLADLLDRHYWVRRESPFPHVVARDVFRPGPYRAMADAFRATLALGFDDRPGTARFGRSMRGYDAYGLTFGPDLAGPFRVFTSRPWHDLLEAVTGVTATGDINCGLHHHRPGSANGRVHNDLNPGWFADYPSPDGIRTTRHDLCSYTSGEAHRPGVIPRETMRAVAMLLYLNNPPWSPGDGGETGLYAAASDPVDRPAAVVPPINNSMLIFECTPHSYHTFLGNRAGERNCVIMWLHRCKDEAVRRWGDGSIVYWKG